MHSEETISQLAHACSVTRNCRRKSTYQIQVSSFTRETVMFTHPPLVWCYHPQLKMTNHVESPLHHPAAGRTSLPLDNAIPVSKNWFTLTFLENKHLLTIPFSRFSHTSSLIINRPDENSEWQHNRYPDGST